MTFQGSYEVVNLEDSEDETEPLSVDQICEENIQLFMRYVHVISL